MDLDHNTLVAFAKSGGLFYFIAFSIAILVYTFWPKNRKKFDRAKRDILEHGDRPAVDARQEKKDQDRDDEEQEQVQGRDRRKEDGTWR